jgi:hypothetical protein
MIEFKEISRILSKYRAWRILVYMFVALIYIPAKTIAESFMGFWEVILDSKDSAKSAYKTILYVIKEDFNKL